MAHRIVVTFEKPSLGNFAVKNHIKKCILAALPDKVRVLAHTE